MLTIPVVKKGLRDQKIADVEILYGPDFPRRHIDVLTACYRGAAFFDAYAPTLFAMMRAGHRKLADLTIALSEWLAQVFGIAVRRIRAVTMNSAGAKAELLVHLCRQLDATRYISPVGSHDYLADSHAFAEAGIELCYHGYEHPSYPQLHGSFLPHMAAIDLLFNVGPGSLRRPSCNAAPARNCACARRLEACSRQEHSPVWRPSDDCAHTRYGATLGAVRCNPCFYGVLTHRRIGRKYWL
jgi:hypothetical protein